jgi:hypothetical protein
MADGPPEQRGVNVWGMALYVLAGAVAVAALYVTVRVWCWHGCVTPFDAQWQRLTEAAAIAQEEGASLGEGERKVVDLPDEYTDLAEGGEVAVERVDGELVVIFFRLGNGELMDSAMVYASSGVRERGRFLDDYCIDSVYSQGAGWHEVFLRDWVPVLGPCR